MKLQTNVDPLEVAKFDALAASWWDLNGDSKPLHDINPIRLDFIKPVSYTHLTLPTKRIV